MMFSLALSLVFAPSELPRVFLDGERELRLGFAQPTAVASLSGFTFKVGGKTIRIVKAEPVGQPVRPRTKPLEPGRVVLPGTLQSAAGGNDWDPDGESTQMTRLREGVYELILKLPKGNFEYKVARGGSWAENYGAGFRRDGTNLALSVPADGTLVRFVVDFNAQTVKNSLQNSEIEAPTRLPEVPPPPGNAGYLAAKLTLAEAVLPSQITLPMTLDVGGGNSARVFAREFLSRAEFQYDGALGSFWKPNQTTFKVWSPVASRVEVLLYRSAIGGSPEVVPMTRGSRGVWQAVARGDLHGRFYRYRFSHYGNTTTATDMNCFAANRDSTRSMVVNLASTNPSGWPSVPKVRHRDQTDAVLYEMHVRDFTADPASGVAPLARGKYAGVAQSGTRLGNFKTGLDYLVDLGVTDIHLLPVQNFLNSSPTEYTWGYATNLFNVPEESYAARPDEPLEVIREFKGMVQGLHRAGLRVVLDVVYNHTWPPEGADSNFEQTVPYYYFRTNDRGEMLNESGVGNALHDERPMARKFVRDSLLYWQKEYGIDGFRFDLIGMFTRDSVVDWTNALRKQRADTVLYGEPWTGGGPTRFGKGTQRGSGIAVFNDRFRNLFRGELDGPGAGFISGGGGSAAELVTRIQGSVRDFAAAPTETVNYVSAHDNLTLWDKIALSQPGDSSAEREKTVRLAGAAVLFSQGVPFLEGGVQIGRTKGGNRNSYNVAAPNEYDWKRAATFGSLNNYYRGLIQVRKAYAGFRHATTESAKRDVQFLLAEDGFAVYTVENGRVLVALNGSREAKKVTMPSGGWEQIVSAQTAGILPLRVARSSESVPGMSAAVFRRK